MKRSTTALMGAVLLLAGCSSGGGGVQPPRSIPTTLMWTPVTQLTDEGPLEDLTGYTIVMQPSGGTPTQSEVSADTTSVRLPLQSGSWTFSVWANSASRGPGEVATTTRVID